MKNLIKFPELQKIEEKFDKMIARYNYNIVYVFYVKVDEIIMPTEYCEELVRDCKRNESLILENKLDDVPFYLMYKNIELFNKKINTLEIEEVYRVLINDFTSSYYEMIERAEIDALIDRLKATAAPSSPGRTYIERIQSYIAKYFRKNHNTIDTSNSTEVSNYVAKQGITKEVFVTTLVKEAKDQRKVIGEFQQILDRLLDGLDK